MAMGGWAISGGRLRNIQMIKVAGPGIGYICSLKERGTSGQ